MQIVLFCFWVGVQLMFFVLPWILLVSLECYVLVYLRWLLSSCCQVWYFMSTFTMKKRWLLGMPVSRCHIVKVQGRWTSIIHCHILCVFRALFEILVMYQREVSNWDYVPKKELWNKNSCVLNSHFMIFKVSCKDRPFVFETKPKNDCSCSECDHESCEMQLNAI